MIAKILGKDLNIAGPLIRIGRLNAEQFESLPDPTTFVEVLRHSGTRVDLLTFVENVSNTSPRFAYPMEWDNLAVLAVSTFDNWWTKQINGKTRNMVRRAEKGGVATREIPFDDDLVEGISRIYNETRIRQGRRFPHYEKNIATVRAENGTFLNRSVFIGAFLEGDLIGFAKLVSHEDRQQAGLMQIISMIKHRDKAPTNALIAQAVKSCVQRQIPYLFYSHFAYGKKQRDSLSDFKEHNGFQRIDLPRYYVPLTRWGAVGLGLGFHKRLIDQVPESVQTKLRSIRNLRTVGLLRTERKML